MELLFGNAGFSGGKKTGKSREKHSRQGENKDAHSDHI